MFDSDALGSLNVRSTKTIKKKISIILMVVEEIDFVTSASVELILFVKTFDPFSSY